MLNQNEERSEKITRKDQPVPSLNRSGSINKPGEAEAPFKIKTYEIQCKAGTGRNALNDMAVYLMWASLSGLA